MLGQVYWRVVPSQAWLSATTRTGTPALFDNDYHSGDARGMTSTVLAADAISINFGATVAVRDVSLDVHADQTVAILGANGSGKSTLVRALLGLVTPQTGIVTLFGEPVASRQAQLERVGYVPQRTTAQGGLAASAAEVVEAGLLSRTSRRLPPDGAARARAALATMGLADRADSPVGALSGGQQQRVLIARALVRDPDILIMDEPLAGVDADHQVVVADVVRAAHDRGAAVVLVLHEAGPLAPLLQRAVVLDRGCVTHDGTPPAEVGVHAMPGHDHVHPHADPVPEPSDLQRGVL